MLNFAALNAMIDRQGGTWLPYAYETEELELDNASNMVVTVEIKLTDSKGFIWAGGMHKTNMATVQAGTDVLYGGLAIKFDGSTSYGQLCKEPFMIDALFSRGGNTGELRGLPVPVLIEGQSTIGFTVSNRTGLAINARIAFIGVKRA